MVAVTLVVFATAYVVTVFGNVGQVREVAEGADHADGLVTGEILQQPVQRLAGPGVLLEPEGDRELAHFLDQLEGFLAFLFADDVAKQPPEQTDVFHQRTVLGGGVALIARQGCRGCRGARGSGARH